MTEPSRRDLIKTAAAATLVASGISGVESASAQTERAAAGPIIDANMHWLPETLFTDQDLLDAFLTSVPREYSIYAELVPIPGKNLKQIVIEQPRGYEVLNYAENQYNSKDQVASMQQAKIDKAILRMPCWQEWLGLDACKKINTGLAEHLKRYPGRFHALAVVPPWGTRDSIKELERCIKELGFSGVQMAAHYGKLYLDDDMFKPYFKVLNQLNVPVVVHHTPMPVDYDSIIPYTNLRRQYGRCIAQGTAVGRELFSGMFEEFPNLKMIHSMLGGGFFTYVSMLVPEKTGRDEVDRFDAQTEKIRGYLDRNLFFDMSGAPQWGKAQLECAIKVLGAEHILYGGSYPIRMDWFHQGVDYVRSLAIGDREKALVLGGNAARLFKIS